MYCSQTFPSSPLGSSSDSPMKDLCLLVNNEIFQRTNSSSESRKPQELALVQDWIFEIQLPFLVFSPKPKVISCTTTNLSLKELFREASIYSYLDPGTFTTRFSTVETRRSTEAREVLGWAAIIRSRSTGGRQSRARITRGRGRFSQPRMAGIDPVI